MKIPLKIFLLILCFCLRSAFGQNIDSLKLLLKNAGNDTAKSFLLRELVNAMEPGESYDFNQQLKEHAETNLAKVKSRGRNYNIFRKDLALALNNLGYILDVQGEPDKSIAYYLESAKIELELGNRYDYALALSNLGSIYDEKSDLDSAIYYYLKAEKILKTESNQEGYSIVINNLGLAYGKIGDVKLSLQYLEKSLAIMEKLKNIEGESSLLISIGQVYAEQGSEEKALEYYKRSLKIAEAIGLNENVVTAKNNIAFIYKGRFQKKGDTRDLETARALFEESLQIARDKNIGSLLANQLNNVGYIFKLQKDYHKALEYYNESLQLAIKRGDKFGQALTLDNIGEIYLKKNELAPAEKFIRQSYELSRSIRYMNRIESAAQGLYIVYKRKGNYKDALTYQEVYIGLRDSLSNEGTRKAALRSQIKYEYEKQATADSVSHAKEIEIREAESQKQAAEITVRKNQQYALFGGLTLVIIFSGFLYNRFKVTQKQKEIIEEQKITAEEQKLLVEEKQKEILDSIYYAQRIQRSLLPTDKYLEKRIGRKVS